MRTSNANDTDIEDEFTVRVNIVPRWYGVRDT